MCHRRARFEPGGLLRLLDGVPDGREPIALHGDLFLMRLLYRARNSIAPGPIDGNGFQSCGSMSRCTRSSWKPAVRRASSGNSESARREEPRNSIGFGGNIQEVV